MTLSRMDLREHARETLFRCKCAMHGLSGGDFHALPAESVARLIVEAEWVRFRAPKNANGSRARYFYAYLQRLAREA